MNISARRVGVQHYKREFVLKRWHGIGAVITDRVNEWNKN